MSGGIVLPLGLLAALVSAGLGWRTRYRQTALWTALLVVGQAASLQIILAGPVVSYQHYLPWGRLFETDYRLATTILALQVVLVATGLLSRTGAIARWIRSVFGWRAILLLGIFVLSSATLSLSPFVFGRELILASLVQAVALGTVLLAAWALPSEGARAIQHWFDRLGEEPSGQRGPDRLVLYAAIMVTLVAATLAVLVYQRHPHVPDEVGYLIQARYFAEGRLSLPLPPAAAAFNLDLLYYGPTQVFSPFPPGWPAVLAIGVKLGAPWLLNPLLAGLNLFLVSALLRRLYDRRIARLTVLLLALSPWYVFLAMSFMAHTFTLTCVLLAAYGVERGRESGRLTWPLIGGIALGFVTLIRPLDGLILGGLLGLWAIGVGGRRLKWVPLAAFVVSTGAVTALNLPYNRALTGNARVFPVMAYFDKYYGPHSNDMGFGPERGVGWAGLDPFPGHNLRDAFINTDFNVFATNVELLGWAAGSFLLPLIVLLAGRARRVDWLMIAVIAAVILAHGLYWFSGGPDFGARYWYLALLPAIALAARGLELLGQLVEETGAVSDARGRVFFAVLAVSAAAVVTFYPWRSTNKYFHYRGMRPDVIRLARERGFGRSLVIIRGHRHPDYASAAVYNPVDMSAAVPIYAWGTTPEAVREALQVYPDRPVWIVDGPTITHQGYQVVAGPLDTKSALTELTQ